MTTAEIIVLTNEVNIYFDNNADEEDVEEHIVDVINEEDNNLLVIDHMIDNA
jgi:hypothetical protein